MFIGHYAVALAAKRVAPRTSLGTLFAAAQLLDLVWPILLLLGLERVKVDPGNTAFTPLDFVRYPWTHSLALVVVWSVLFGFAYWKRTGSLHGAWVVGALVLSHWALDFLSHRPDLPLAPGAPRVGLGLWNSVPATIVVEAGLFLAGVATYATATRPRTRAGSLGFWALVVLLGAIYVGNVLGPPPPNQTAIAVASLLLWLFLPWAAWVDRNRDAATPLEIRTEKAED